MNCEAQSSPLNVRLNGFQRASVDTTRYVAAQGMWLAMGVVLDFGGVAVAVDSSAATVGVESVSSSFFFSSSLGGGGGGIG